MVQVLRKPEESSLSPARWDFVRELWIHHDAAGRPKADRIYGKIGELNEASETGGTASTETIRRMLRGLTVSPNWGTTRAVLCALCSLAGYDPQKPQENHFGDEYPSPEERLREAWSLALDDPHRGKPPQAGPAGQWGGGYSGEPPF